jgi:hypothetical protein
MQQDYGMASPAAQATAALDAASCVQVTVKSVYQKHGRMYYRCSAPLGKDLEVVAEDWTSRTLAWKGQNWPCYAYLEKKSGIQHYAFSLEP